MSLDIGFATQTPALPGGGGTVAGLGETFSPDLATGTGTFTIPLDLPHGPNDIGPKLTLRYSTGSPNGPFGLGWSLPLPRILRSTVGGYPSFDGTDTLVLEGSGPLVRTAGGGLRPEVDSGDWRITRLGATDNDGFVVTDRNGTRFHLGVTTQGRVLGAADVPAAWLLERIEDNLGESATFKWTGDDGDRLLGSVTYGPYRVELSYEDRPDPIRSAVLGRLNTVGQRCHAIELLLPADPQPVVRRWNLDYALAEPSGVSVLRQVTLTGLSNDGAELSAPPLSMTWSTPGPVRLEHLPSLDPASPPPPLDSSRRVDLVDWFGDGLPDVVAVTPAGSVRVWRNEGGRFARPQTVGEFAALADPATPVGLIDLDGDGLADFVPLSRPATGFHPRTAAGVQRPVSWRVGPSVALGDPRARVVDLDGDGRADLAFTAGSSLLLAARADDGGWAATPVVATIPGPTDPPVNLADPHIHMADMSGDGTPDLVRVDGGGVRWWPHLGGGVFGEQIVMSSPPILPVGVDPRRVALVDLDGNGCADLLLVDDGRVTWWPNCGGDHFMLPRVVDHLPTQAMSDVRVADALGTGVPALVFSVDTPAGGARWLALDLLGSSRCGLLKSIDNGLGLTTTISYGNSAQEAARDRSHGDGWMSRLPVVLSVVAATQVADAATGRVERVEYQYHEGRYDTVLRELCGFGRVDQDEIGDLAVPTLRTTRWFHQGTHPDGTEPADASQRRRLRSVRGRMRAERRQTLDGLVFDEKAWDWESTEDPDDDRIIIPRLRRSTKASFEGAASPASGIVTETLTWDGHGNATSGREQAFIAAPLPALAGPAARADVEPSTQLEPPVGGDLVLQATLVTKSVFASDPADRYRSRVARVTQTDGDGQVVADSITAYDALPFGQVGAEGLVTSRHSLVLTDELVDAVHGADPPDLETFGYRRRQEGPGWWVDQATYHRSVDANGVHGTVTGPLGAVTFLRLDATSSQPAEIVDPGGNTVRSVYDPRVCRPVRLTDAAGSVTTATYDALSRLVAQHEPGDPAGSPTTTLSYDLTVAPAVVTTTTASGHPNEPALVRRQLVDGAGRVVETRVVDDGGEVVEGATVFGARGRPVRVHMPGGAASPVWVEPDPGEPHVAMQYDALGRLVASTRPDGAVRRTTYLPGVIEERDEEATRSDPGAAHAGSFVRRVLNAAGRVQAVEQSLAGRVVRTVTEFDAHGAVHSNVAADGTATILDNDLVGRSIRVTRPERSQVSVYDAAGNMVEVRVGTHRVTRKYDRSNRLSSVHHGGPGSPAVVTCTYHDHGAPAPADAGTHTDGGRLVAVDDEAGRTIYDYDERGRLARKTMTPAGRPTLDLQLAHRPDGRLDRIVYPGSGAAAGPAVAYRYDRRGRLFSVSGVIDSIIWDNFGHRTTVHYTNGVVEQTPHDPATGWCSGITVVGPGGVLREVALDHDRVGNVLALTSADPDLAWTYVYDDWYRLVQATGSASTEAFTWADNGDLAARDGVGPFTYGGNGAATSLLTTAGQDDYTWDDRGHLAGAPWGTHTVDAEGRLRQIDLTGGGLHELTYGHTGVLAHHVVRDAAGTVTREAVRPDALVTIEDEVLVYSFTDGDRIVARSTGGATQWHHHDHLGSLVLVTDSGGAEMLRIRYGPWGEILDRTGAGNDHGDGFGGGTRPGDGMDGLVLLGARWYCPRIGRFLAPDPVVADTTDPLAWHPYLYARGNPASYTDPTGKSFWKVFGAIVAAIAIVALIVVVSVLTFGVGTIGIGVFIAAMVGVAAGGVIGGIAAARAGGEWDDILLGVLVGGAVGGWAAFGAALAGPAVAGAFGLKGMVGGAVAGAVSGAINGAAMGFASGFAGGKAESISDVLEKMLVGAVVGLVVGGAIGALSGYTPSTTKPSGPEGAGAASSPGAAPGTAPGGAVPGGAAGGGPSSYSTNDMGEAGKYLIGEGIGYAGKKALEAYGPAVATTLAPYAASVIAQTIAVDLLAGGTSAFWDDIKEYVRTHPVEIGPIKIGGSF